MKAASILKQSNDGKLQRISLKTAVKDHSKTNQAELYRDIQTQQNIKNVNDKQ